MFTVTFVLYEKNGIDRTEALRYWRETHGPIVAKVPGVTRYLQQHAVAAPDGQPPFLGVASLSFADQDAFGGAWNADHSWTFGMTTLLDGLATLIEKRATPTAAGGS